MLLTSARKTLKGLKSLVLILLFSTSVIFTITTNTVLTSAQTSTYPNSNSTVGMNLTGVVDWTTQWPFVDAFKVARPWISQRQNASFGQGGDLNLTYPDNWIAAFKPGQYAETVMFDNGKAHYPGGQYVLLYDGEGTISFNFGSATIASQTPGRMLVDVVPKDTGIWLQILATNPANPIRNIRFIMPGFENTYQTQPFHPLFLQRLSKFKTLRFMDWMRTNNSLEGSKWGERATPKYFTQASDKGVALEYIIALANALHADPWFTIPHLATDGYIHLFAVLVRERLDPTLKPHIEYSNEVWNGLFSQNKHAAQTGLALGLQEYGESTEMRYYSQRSVQVFKIWEEVFGGKNRLVRILSGQAVNPWIGEQILKWKSAYKYADAYAIAPYFGPTDDVNNPANANKTLQMTTEQIIDDTLNRINGGLKQNIIDNYNLTQRFGLKLIAYEGGLGLESSRMPADKEPQVTALFLAVNRHPRMREAYLKYLNMWKASGGGLFMHYYDVGLFTKYGSWGALEYQNQNPSTAPKYLGIMDFIGG